MAKFSLRERVRWSDVDAAEIIFYGSYIRFFEMAESEMFRQLGFGYRQMYEALDIWLPRRHIQCDFLAVSRLDDLLEVSCWVSKVGRSSLTLSFTVDIVERSASPETPTATCPQGGSASPETPTATCPQGGSASPETPLIRAASASYVLVAVDRRNFSKLPLPSALVKALEAYPG